MVFSKQQQQKIVQNKYGDLRRESESNEEIDIFEEDYHIDRAQLLLHN